MKNIALLLALISLTSLSTAQDSNLSLHELDSVITYLQEHGKTSEAVKYLKIAQSKVLNELGEKDSLYILYTNHIGYCYTELRQFDACKAAHDRAKEIVLKYYGKNHPFYANTLGGYVRMYKNEKKIDEAIATALEAKDIYLKTRGAQSKDYGMITNLLATCYNIVGRHEEAEKYYLQAKKAQEAIDSNSRAYATAIGNLAMLYRRMGHWELAEPLLSKRVSVEAKLSSESVSYATALEHLAIIYVDMGRYEEAEPLLLQSRNLRGKTLGKNHPDYALILNNLGGYYMRTKQYSKAESVFVEALDLIKTLPEISRNPGLPLGNLARVYQITKQYSKAQAIYAEMLVGINKGKSLNEMYHIPPLFGAADLHKTMGEYDKALAYLHRAKGIYLAFVGSDNPEYAAAMGKIAKFHTEQHQYDSAWHYTNEAMRALTGLGCKYPIQESWANDFLQLKWASVEHRNIAINLLEEVYALVDSTNQADKQQQHYLLAKTALSTISEIHNEFTSDKDKIRVLSLSDKWIQRALEALDMQKQPQDAFAFIEQNKSALLLQATRASNLEQMGNIPDSLAKQEKELYKQQAALQATLLEKHTETEKDSLRNELNLINIDIKKFKTKVETNYPNYAKQKYQQTTAKATEIQALLADNMAFLEYMITPQQVYLVYLDKNNMFIDKLPIPDKELNPRIKALHKCLSHYDRITQQPDSAYIEFTDNAHWFYQQLLAPARKHAPNSIDHLIVVTDGELGYLPFETFLVEAANGDGNFGSLHYLINDFKISYNHSATLWKENKAQQRKSNNGQIFAMAADYAIAVDSVKQQYRLPVHQRLRGSLTPLPAAQKEVEVLQENFSGNFSFGLQSNERFFKQEAHQYAIIHLATHGLLNTKEPILSSIALTENGDSAENNFLHAYEIAKMQLNADLVVLSACETGFGKFERGNGIASLARAFMYAGAPAMVVSLWEVNDNSTSTIMQHFYQHLAAGKDKADALRQAKIEYRQKASGIAAHPAYWSAFILTGDEAPINMQRKGGAAWWLWLGGGLLLLLVVVLFAAKRKRE